MRLDSIIMRMYDGEGNYIGPPTRKFVFNGEVIDIDEYAGEYNIVLPDAGE